MWTKNCTAGGTPELIYSKCWGAPVASDSYYMTCGTGIENSPSTLPSALLTACQAGTGDTRTLITRGASIWQALTINPDSDGYLLWQCVDSYKAPGGAALGSSGYFPRAALANGLSSPVQVVWPLVQTRLMEWASSYSAAGLPAV